MDKINRFIKPKITENEIEFIQQFIQNNPSLGRTQLSKQLCILWNWCGPNGQYKDISCRDMLRELDKRGKITLPVSQNAMHKLRKRTSVKHLNHDTTPVTKSLRELLPLKIEIVSSGTLSNCYKSFIDQYHYLGFDRTIGENIKYIVYSCNNIPLACLLFGSAAWSCSPRDKFIGWDNDCRRENLCFVTNNSRYLILPWVTVPHLASHILSVISRRISNDWMNKYAHPVYLLESFVEQNRFRGTCYKAANWSNTGYTTGWGRNGGHTAELPVKDVYLYPLIKNFRMKLQDSSPMNFDIKL